MWSVWNKVLFLLFQSGTLKCNSLSKFDHVAQIYSITVLVHVDFVYMYSVWKKRLISMYFFKLNRIQINFTWTRVRLTRVSYRSIKNRCLDDFCCTFVLSRGMFRNLLEGGRGQTIIPRLFSGLVRYLMKNWDSWAPGIETLIV